MTTLVTKKPPFVTPDFGHTKGNYEAMPKAKVRATKWLLNHLLSVVKSLETYFIYPLTVEVKNLTKLEAYIHAPGIRFQVVLTDGEPRLNRANRYQITGEIPFTYPEGMGEIVSTVSNASSTFSCNRYAEDIAKDIWTRWYPRYNSWVGTHQAVIEAYDQSVAQLDIASNLLFATGIIKPFRLNHVGTKGSLVLRKIQVADGAPHEMEKSPEGSVAISSDAAMPNGVRADLHLNGLPVNVVADILNYLRTKGWCDTGEAQALGVNGVATKYGKGVNAILPS